MHFKLVDISEKRWTRLLDAAPAATLQQDWAYGDAVEAMGQKAHRFLIKAEAGGDLGLVQLFERRFWGSITVLALMRGPVWLSGEPPQQADTALIEALRQHFRRAAIMYTPEASNTLDVAPGLHRVMTGYSTIRLDLSQAIQKLRAGLHGKWRNMLKRAEAEKIQIDERQSGLLVDWLIEHNERNRKKIGYRSASPDFFYALGQASSRRKRQFSLLALKKSNPVAGITLQIHGREASYLLGYTNAAGRELRAHHRLLWQACTILKDRGVTGFDLGGIETRHAEGLARFKLGMGGELRTLRGTYLSPPRLI